MFVIIDAQIGNLRNVEKAFQKLGYQAEISSEVEKIKKALVLILPGVGNFGRAMENLNNLNLTNQLVEKIRAGTPILGICLGLQIFFENSEESPEVAGLGVLKGKVKKFPATPDLKVPQIGWNSLKIEKKDEPMLQNLNQENPMVYFVHSYYVVPQEKEIITASTSYGLEFASAVHSQNIWGVQFHPEKSGAIGLKILDNFAKAALKGAKR